MTTYRAAAALPYDDHERAAACLRGQLRFMARIDGAAPDWTTLEIEGPTESLGLRGGTWFEWTATVEARSRSGSRLPIPLS